MTQYVILQLRNTKGNTYRKLMINENDDLKYVKMITESQEIYYTEFKKAKIINLTNDYVVNRKLLEEIIDLFHDNSDILKQLQLNQFEKFSNVVSKISKILN